MLLPVTQYAAHHNKTDRTVRRWLKDDLLPGAVLQDGKWMIPADVLPMPTSAPTGSVVTTRAPDPAATPPSTLAGALDQLPAYLTTDQAAHLLGLKPYTVARHAKRWGGERLGGPNGQAWMIPAAAVRTVAGL
jgi:hypothetical protein